VPVRIFADPRPSALDFRILACVSMHDGMSLKKGSGRGCYASFKLLTSEVGCDTSNLSKSLKRLVEWGYLAKEAQADRRCSTYRVIFAEPGESWRNDQQSLVGETANDRPEIVGRGESGNGGNPPQTEQHYSSLKELDSAEAALSKDFGENVGAKRAMIERAWEAKSFTWEDLIEWHHWLSKFDANVQWSARLYYLIDTALWEENRGPYAEGTAA